MSDVPHNIQVVQQKIRKAAHTAGREQAPPSLVAVSKNQPPEKILVALKIGHRLFGENKVQEAKDHWAALRPQYPDLRLHLIGPLQTNKVRDAITLFDCIETLDREKLAVAIKEEGIKQGKNTECFIQVNTGEEVQKAGIPPLQLQEFYKYALHDCGLNITGLMCIPPVEDPAGLHFNLLRKYARILNLSNLSMGMSGDFEKAIAAGATHVRIGTALFGSRL